MSSPRNRVRLKTGDSRLVVVQDNLQPCPYRSGLIARMPLRLHIGGVTTEITDNLLASGFRRSGDFLYSPQCPTCQECRPTRVNVHEFLWTDSFRRVLRRGDHELSVYWGQPSVDEDRVRLFNRHRDERHLGLRDEPIDGDSYRAFLVDSCCETVELSIYHSDQLIAVATVDCGQSSVSAVYTYFDPSFSRYSLGTYAILKQIQWSLETGRTFVYLGMYVADNKHLNYKARYLPQERFIDGEWVPF